MAQSFSRALGKLVGVSFTYISKVENHQLDFGEYPSEDLIRKLAKALEVDEDELLRWWIHAFSWKVEVMEPLALREAIADELRRALAAYVTPACAAPSPR